MALSSGASLTLTGNKDTVSEAGSDTVTTSGTGINVTVAGTGNAATLTHGTVTLGSNASATISGTGNTVTAGANNTISDSGSSTQIKVNSNAGNLLVNNFGSDSSGVIDLLTGGYASASAAYAALTSDGNGGSLLALGASGSIDIAGVAKSSLSAANFKIG